MWSQDVENLCEGIRSNCGYMNLYHQKRHEYLKGYLKYFKIPILCINAAGIFCAVGLQPYIQQELISLISCFLSMSSGLLASLEMYLGIEKNMSLELLSSKEYYILEKDIFRVLSIQAENRTIDGKQFLEQIYNRYVKLYENSNVLNKKIIDSLRPIQLSTSDKDSDTSSENKV
jgi:hypothetical protein